MSNNITSYENTIQEWNVLFARQVFIQILTEHKTFDFMLLRTNETKPQ